MAEKGSKPRLDKGREGVRGPAALSPLEGVKAQASQAKEAELRAITDAVSTESRLLVRLIGQSADAVLSRIANGDPLKLYQRAAERIREHHYVLDTDRVFEQALPVVAVGLALEGQECQREGWLNDRIDTAILRVLEKDANEERACIPPADSARHYPVFVQAFFMEPHLARLSSVRLNALEKRVRKGFYHLIVEGRPLEEVLAMDLGGPDQLQEDVLRALQAIGLFDEKGFQELLGRKGGRS